MNGLIAKLLAGSEFYFDPDTLRIWGHEFKSLGRAILRFLVFHTAIILIFFPGSRAAVTSRSLIRNGRNVACSRISDLTQTSPTSQEVPQAAVCSAANGGCPLLRWFDRLAQ